MKFTWLTTSSLLSLGMVLVLGGQIVSGEKTKDKEKPKPITLKGKLTSSDPLDWQRRSSFHKVHQVKLKGGIKYNFTMNATFRPFVRVEDFRGNRLANTTRLGAKTTTVSYLPPKDETYRVIATSVINRKTGAYTIKIKPEVPVLVVKGKITRNDPRDRLRRGRHCKIHKLKMVPGNTYVIHCKTTVHDGYLRLEDSKKRRLAFNDDFKNTRNSRIVYRPTKADTYRVVVTTFGAGTTGPYTLTVTK